MKGFHANKITKVLSMALAAAVLAFLPAGNALTVSADGPTTYYVKYDFDDEDWEYQLADNWDEDRETRSSYYLNENLKNGDIVIVGSNGPMLNIGVRLSNLTITNPTGEVALVTVNNGIDNCFVVDGAIASITGNITNAYIYNNCRANFNSNVTNLYSYADDPEIGPTAAVAGTVTHFVGDNPYKLYMDYYDFDAGSFHLEDGDMITESHHYSKTASATAATPAAAPEASVSSTASATTTSSSGDYDTVPKTGEAAPALWLCLAVAACVSGSILIKRTVR